MLHLTIGSYGGLKINPRWLQQNAISIDPTAYKCLLKAQALLKTDTQLIITRAYQAEGKLLKVLRWFGAKLFALIYPHRKAEITSIFQHNGHATDGTHIDIGIKFKGQAINLLPLSIYTPTFMIARNKKRYFDILSDVENALQQTGFTIHANPTESLQIHCDFQAPYP